MKITKEQLLRGLNNLQRRYSFPMDIQEAEECMILSYKIEIENRGLEYIADNTEVLKKCAKWLKEGKKDGLMLYGSVGSGKTTCARAICRVFNTVHSGADCLEKKQISIVSALEINERVKNYPDMLDFYKRTEFLYIDDLGCESVEVKNFGNSITPVIDILYYRYERKLITICTSNLGNDDLAKRYGDRLADRMKEMFNRLPFTRDSYRK